MRVSGAGVGVAVSPDGDCSSSGLGPGEGSAHKGLKARKSKIKTRLLLNTGSEFVVFFEAPSIP